MKAKRFNSTHTIQYNKGNPYRGQRYCETNRPYSVTILFILPQIDGLKELAEHRSKILTTQNRFTRLNDRTNDRSIHYFIDYKLYLALKRYRQQLTILVEKHIIKIATIKDFSFTVMVNCATIMTNVKRCKQSGSWRLLEYVTHCLVNSLMSVYEIRVITKMYTYCKSRNIYARVFGYYFTSVFFLLVFIGMGVNCFMRMLQGILPEWLQKMVTFKLISQICRYSMQTYSS